MSKLEREESNYYSEMEDISRIQTAHFTAQKMFKAIELNDISEFKRLYDLDAEKGGLILWRLTAKNKEGKSFLELAKEMERNEIINFLKNYK
jgi:hypothetical protein